MIIETIIVLVLLGSLGGMILFAKHFLKHKKHINKSKSNKKKRKNSDFLIGDFLIKFFLKYSSKIAFICFVLVFINVVFQPFSQHTTQITPQPDPTPVPINSTGNFNTFNEMLAPLFNGTLPWWVTVLIFAIPVWTVWRFFRRSSLYYDFVINIFSGFIIVLIGSALIPKFSSQL